MKKILLGTTTLIGAAALFAGAAYAETPKVTVGGFADFQYGYTSDQDLATTHRDSGFRSDTEITFNIDGKTDGGLGYGGFVALEADVLDDSDTQGTNASRTYVYLDGNQWGRLQMGSDLGVTNTMKVDASRIARATGGIDGDFTYYLNVPTTVSNATKAIATPDLILDYGFDGTAGSGAILGNESTENANKISYYTPRFMGLQLGASYIIDNDNRGDTVAPGLDATGEAHDIIAWAANWEGAFSGVGINLGATGEHGESQTTTYNDLRTWQAGAKLSYMGFSVAGSYGDWGDSLRLVSSGDIDGNNFYTLGAAYEMGPFGASVTWMNSHFKNTLTTQGTDFSNLSVGVDYKLAPGFTPYAEVSFVEYDAAATTAGDDNDTSVFLAGTTLSF